MWATTSWPQSIVLNDKKRSGKNPKQTQRKIWNRRGNDFHTANDVVGEFCQKIPPGPESALLDDINFEFWRKLQEPTPRFCIGVDTTLCHHGHTPHPLPLKRNFKIYFWRAMLASTLGGSHKLNPIRGQTGGPHTQSLSQFRLSQIRKELWPRPPPHHSTCIWLQTCTRY